MAEAFSSPSSCLALRTGREYSVLSSSRAPCVFVSGLDLPGHAACQVGVLESKVQGGSAADTGVLWAAAKEKTREASERQRFSLALTSIWLVALPFLSIVPFFPLWLLFPRERCVCKTVTVVAVLLTIT